jgi:uncharacterized membrane protein YgcG
MKRLLTMLLILLTVCTLPTVAFAQSAPSDSFVEDLAGFFTAEEEAQLAQSLSQAVADTDGSCAFYLATHKMAAFYSPKYYGDDFLEKHGLDDDDNIVILIITLDDGVYYYDMYTYGNAYSQISDKEVDYILDNDRVYDNLKGGELLDGSRAFFSLAAQGFNGRVGVSYVIIVLVSLIIALFIGIACCTGVYTSYTKRKKSVDYPLEHFAKMQLTENADVFAGSFVTKRVIQSNSGSSVGGGGRGGGGGHRGGR